MWPGENTPKQVLYSAPLATHILNVGEGSYIFNAGCDITRLDLFA